MSDFEIRPIGFSDEAIQIYCKLFAECFPLSAKYSFDYLRWLYCENPSGRAVGFDGWSGDVLAAHYACIPAPYQYRGQRLQGLLSLNTATGERFRGKGLFPRLAEATYAEATRSGSDFVIGVANANSTPGFVKRLQFELVSPLDAKIGGAIGGGRLMPSPFASVWNNASLHWRQRSPRNRIHSSARDGGVRFWADAGRKPFIVVADRVVANFDAVNLSSVPWRPQLFIGLIPPEIGYAGIAIDVPTRFRPSPLNLIFRCLSSDLAVPKKSEIMFDFLDFDAF